MTDVSNVAVLLSLLVVLAGVIAYTGDMLGTVIGKKRLSLFGARPKRSGRIVGVLAGILIMLVTLGILALTFRQAVRVIFEAQATGEQLRLQEAQIRNLNTQIEDRTDELASAKQIISEAETRREAALTERDQARADLKSLREERTTLERDISKLDRDVRASEKRVDELEVQAEALEKQKEALKAEKDNLDRLNGELDELNETLRERISSQSDELTALEQELETQAQELETARTLAEAASSRNLTYSINQVIHTGVIDAQDAEAAAAQLQAFEQAANTKTANNKAGDLVLRADQRESIVQVALETPEADVVTLRSPVNQYLSEDVEASLEVVPNVKLFDGGQLIVSRQLHLGSPEVQEQRERVREELRSLFSDAGTQLLVKGLADDIYADYADSSLEIEGFTNQLLRLSGPVTVGLSASRDIYSGGPAQLEFIIIN